MRWPQQTCTTMLFLIPNNVTSERPIALLPTLIRWWEGLRVTRGVRWQERHRVGWENTDGRNGGAERTVWETLLEMERFDNRAGEKDQGAITLVLDLVKAFERVSLPAVWAWATHLNIPRKIWRVLRAAEARSVRREGGGVAPDHHGHPPSIQMEWPALSHCVARFPE